MANKKEESVSIFRTKYQTLRLLPADVRHEALDLYLDYAFGYSERDLADLNPEDNPSMAEIMAADMITQHEYWKKRGATNAANRSGSEIVKPDEAPQAAVDKEAVIVEAALRFIERGVKFAYTNAEKAYTANEATGWLKGQTPITDRVAWIQGYKVEEACYSMEAGQIFASLCRQMNIRDRVILDYYIGAFYENGTIAFNFSQKKAETAIIGFFRLADGSGWNTRLTAAAQSLIAKLRPELNNLRFQTIS